MGERRPEVVVEELVAGAAVSGDRFGAVLGAPATAGWMGVDELFGPELAATLVAVGAARGAPGAAVAGALLFEQYAQRLVSPVLLARYRDGEELPAGRHQVRAQVVDGRVTRLAFAQYPVAQSPVAQSPSAPAPDDAVERLVADHLEPLAVAVHRHTRVGLRILRGAMANAVVNMFLHLSWPDPDRARYVDEARSVLARVPEWSGLVNVEARDCGGERWMYTDRETCCLAFRTTVNQAREQQYCSTCPVLPRATTATLFEQATQVYARRQPPHVGAEGVTPITTASTVG